MMTAVEQLSSFYDVGSERFGRASKYSRRQPMHIEQAVRVAAAKSFLQRMDIGKEMVMPRSQAMTIKAAVRACKGFKVSMRKVDETRAALTRIE